MSNLCGVALQIHKAEVDFSGDTCTVDAGISSEKQTAGLNSVGLAASMEGMGTWCFGSGDFFRLVEMGRGESWNNMFIS